MFERLLGLVNRRAAGHEASGGAQNEPQRERLRGRGSYCVFTKVEKVRDDERGEDRYFRKEKAQHAPLLGCERAFGLNDRRGRHSLTHRCGIDCGFWRPPLLLLFLLLHWGVE